MVWELECGVGLFSLCGKYKKVRLLGGSALLVSLGVLGAPGRSVVFLLVQARTFGVFGIVDDVWLGDCLRVDVSV